VPEKERDTTRTRRAVLDAAAAVVRKQGVSASVDAIAREAGVSKGGLLHHFRSRDQLLLAVAEDLALQFREAVYAAVDPRDHAVGRLLRGYINATFDDMEEGWEAAEWALVTAALAVVPGVVALLQEEKRRWDEEFEADGVHPDRVLLIQRAADGASLSGIYEGASDPREMHHARTLLLALSHGSGPLTDTGDAPGRVPANSTGGEHGS
jgi:AcrR family transcriptional regulator